MLTHTNVAASKTKRALQAEGHQVRGGSQGSKDLGASVCWRCQAARAGAGLDHEASSLVR